MCEERSRGAPSWWGGGTRVAGVLFLGCTCLGGGEGLLWAGPGGQVSGDRWGGPLGYGVGGLVPTALACRQVLS